MADMGGDCPGDGAKGSGETYEGVWHVGSGVVMKTWWADKGSEWANG